MTVYTNKKYSSLKIPRSTPIENLQPTSGDPGSVNRTRPLRTIPESPSVRVSNPRTQERELPARKPGAGPEFS